MEADIGWQKTTVGQFIEQFGGEIKTGPFGTKLKASEYTETGVPVISVGEVGFGELVLHGRTPRVDNTVTDRMPEYLLQEGDIVFGRKGAVERSAIVRKNQSGWFLGSDGIRLRLPQNCNSRFIAYQFLSPAHRSWMLQHALGTTMPSLNQKIIARIPIVLPPLPEQRAIAAILGSLDDKIELNRRMNETLESIARSIFKSWFVDFDPVRAKMDGRKPPGMDDATAALFPDSFEESELVTVPQGWRVVVLGDLLELKRGYDLPKHNRIPGPFPIYSSGGQSGFHSEYKVVGPTVVTGRYGTIGNVDFVEGKCWPLNTTLYVRDFKGNEPRFMYYVVQSINFHAYLDKAAVPGINRNDVHRETTVAPPSELQTRFAETIKPMWIRHTRNVKQSETLSALRDTLLPKLLSGELRVGDAEEIIGQLPASKSLKNGELEAEAVSGTKEA
ncbi:MAG: restriction endonuclease subunit S [bacterium]|nr:restriction endonuclease subunit S [bacterium]